MEAIASYRQHRKQGLYRVWDETPRHTIQVRVRPNFNKEKLMEYLIKAVLILSLIGVGIWVSQFPRTK